VRLFSGQGRQPARAQHRGERPVRTRSMAWRSTLARYLRPRASTPSATSLRRCSSSRREAVELEIVLQLEPLGFSSGTLFPNGSCWSHRHTVVPAASATRRGVSR
jgi:hypothetical protein